MAAEIDDTLPERGDPAPYAHLGRSEQMRLKINRVTSKLQGRFLPSRKQLCQLMCDTEKRYGGFVSNVPGMQSALEGDLGDGVTCTGGDRMGPVHYYESFYARHFERFVRRSERVVLAEIGILRGTGCALWSDLFANGRIIGCDIFLDNIQGNMENLKSRGAFTNDNLELHIYDQFVDNTDYIAEFLAGDRLDIVIDDGCHARDAIVQTARSMKPHLAADYVYVIEDFIFDAADFALIEEIFPGACYCRYGEITFITP